MSRTLLIALCLGLVAVCGGRAQANLVVNGGFETGTPGSAPPAPWVSNDGVFIDNTPGFSHSGSQNAAMGNSSTGGPGTLSQLLPTVAGQDYILDFWVFDELANPADQFTASLGSFSLPTIIGATTPVYTEFTVTVPSADVGNNATLSFSAINAIADWNLDDVSVRIAHVAAYLAILGDRLGDELRSAAFP